MAPITLRFLVEPVDLGLGGHVRGGTVMKWIDQAGYACATAWTRGPCILVYASSIRLARTLRVNDMVEVQARLAFTGQSHMNIVVELRSGPLTQGKLEKTTECLVVYLAVDSEGTPLPVNAWTPETPGEMALASSARAQYEGTRPAPLE